MGNVRRDKIPKEISVSTLNVPNAKFDVQGKDTSKLHLIVDMNRIGSNLFITKMEYTHFAPRSGKNFLFDLSLLRWPDSQSFLWSISSFPIEYREKAEALAKECGLRLADGIPTLFDEVGAHQFPLDGPTVYTLENVAGHQVYNNDKAAFDKLVKEEHEAVDAIINADRDKLIVEMSNRGYTIEQITRILSHWESGDEEYEESPNAEQ